MTNTSLSTPRRLATLSGTQLDLGVYDAQVVAGVFYNSYSGPSDGILQRVTSVVDGPIAVICSVDILVNGALVGTVAVPAGAVAGDVVASGLRVPMPRDASVQINFAGDAGNANTLIRLVGWVSV